MPSLKWYIQRASAMSPQEIAHRLKMQVLKRRWRSELAQNKHRPAIVMHWDKLPKRDYQLDDTIPDTEIRQLLDEANAYLEHRWFYGGMNGLQEEPINWHTDPLSGKSAPLKFGFDINHRDEASVGNIKITWEKSRHHHLTVLALAYLLTKDERYSAEVARQLLDWIEQNPYLVGVNWTHPMEQGLRLLAWVWCERFLRGSRHYDQLFGRNSPIWESIYFHQLFIVQTYSQGSSANNHLIGEMAGLFVAAAAFPIFAESVQWQKLAYRVLEEEVNLQTFPSGINRELAFSYQFFVIEFCILALLEEGLTTFRFSEQYRSHLRHMLEVIPHLTDAGGNLPRYGDGDEGMGIQLQARSARRDAWLYRVGIGLLGADVPVRDAGQLASTALGFPDIQPTSWKGIQQSTAFRDAGLYILTDERWQANEIFVMADAGVHGYLSIAAHAHADALSFTLSVAGKPFFIDPGTYAYHTEHDWRAYFRGSRAHNTVVVDEQDQSTQAGAFLWTQQANVTVHDWQATEHGARLRASHDGYQGIGVIHERDLVLDKREITIADTLQGSGQHKIEVLFHTAPECEVKQISASEVQITRDNVSLRLCLPSEMTISVVRAGADIGWYSSEFAVKQETYTIVAQADVTLPARFNTSVEIRGNN